MSLKAQSQIQVSEARITLRIVANDTRRPQVRRYPFGAGLFGFKDRVWVQHEGLCGRELNQGVRPCA